MPSLESGDRPYCPTDLFTFNSQTGYCVQCLFYKQTKYTFTIHFDRPTLLNNLFSLPCVFLNRDLFKACSKFLRLLFDSYFSIC